MARRIEGKISAAPAAKRQKRRDDTAELKVQEVAAALEREKAKRVEPLSSSLMAPSAIETGADTLRPRAADVPPSEAQEEETAPDVEIPATEVFRFLQNYLLEVNFVGKVYIKKGTIYSYSGNLTFWVKESRQGGIPAMVIVTDRDA